MPHRATGRGACSTAPVPHRGAGSIGPRWPDRGGRAHQNSTPWDVTACTSRARVGTAPNQPCAGRQTGVCGSCAIPAVPPSGRQPGVPGRVLAGVVRIEVDETPLDLPVPDLEDVAPTSGAPVGYSRAPRAVLMFAVTCPLRD